MRLRKGAQLGQVNGSITAHSLISSKLGLGRAIRWSWMVQSKWVLSLDLSPPPLKGSLNMWQPASGPQFGGRQVVHFQDPKQLRITSGSPWCPMLGGLLLGAGVGCSVYL